MSKELNRGRVLHAVLQLADIASDDEASGAREAFAEDDGDDADCDEASMGNSEGDVGGSDVNMKVYSEDGGEPETNAGEVKSQSRHDPHNPRKHAGKRQDQDEEHEVIIYHGTPFSSNTTINNNTMYSTTVGTIDENGTPRS